MEIAVSAPGLLSIIVPAYNEERRLGATLGRVLGWADSAGRQVEVVVADDGSRDATAEVARRAGDARVRVLRLDPNRGKGAALRAGVASSRGELVLVTDADLSTPIEEIERLERELVRADVAIGSRAVGGARITEHQPFWREWSGRAFNRILRLLAVSGFHDTQCGFKLLRGEAARELFARLTIDRYAFDVELLWLAGRLGYRVREVGVEWRNDRSSRVRLWRDGPYMLFDVLRFRWRHRRLSPRRQGERAT
jgi:dolichyl-phosphate beta-glucosyltransferase